MYAVGDICTKGDSEWSARRVLGGVYNLSTLGGVEVEVGFETVAADSGDNAEKVECIWNKLEQYLFHGPPKSSWLWESGLHRDQQPPGSSELWEKPSQR